MRRVYCLYDLVAATFLGHVLVDRADAPVIRMFHDLLKDDKTGPGQHPADYELRFLGNIADDGELVPAPAPQVVATGSAWLAAVTAQAEPRLAFEDIDK
jgi:hypothetical protein